MKRMSNMTKLAMAVAMLFAVNMNANAQLGGLLNKAKKAVTKETTQSVQEKQARERAIATSPDRQEAEGARAAGGMDKYLGLDKTENGRILWKYAGMNQDEYTKSSQIKSAFNASNQIVNVLRYLKGNTESFGNFKNTENVLYIFNNNVADDLKRAEKASKSSPAIPAKDLAALKAEAARVKKLYMERTGATEKSAEEKKAEADQAYVQDIINKNYLLDNLTDKNRQAKAVADYKAKVNAKVKQQLAPTKILGTYSTSAAWQGLPLQNYPELKEKYESVQEMQFKTFYEKGGKYYVVKSAFRQSIPKGDNKSGAQPQKFYWPGVETPVEIPAEKIQGKF